MSALFEDGSSGLLVDVAWSQNIHAIKHQHELGAVFRCLFLSLSLRLSPRLSPSLLLFDVTFFLALSCSPLLSFSLARARVRPPLSCSLSLLLSLSLSLIQTCLNYVMSV